MANPILSPKREVERVHRYRAAVVTLALQKAKRVIEWKIRAQGHKLAEYSSRDLWLLAEGYFDQNRAELIAGAEEVIATWPGFARWRLPAEESVRNVTLRTLGQSQPPQGEENCQ